MAKTNTTPVEFIETTSTNLTTVQENHPGAFIHVNDENGDDTLYIGDDQVTDKFNLGDTVLSTQTLKVGGLESTTFNALKNKTVSEILIEILSPISVQSVTLNKNSATMKVGGSEGTLTLTAIVNPSNASNKTVTWTSSNTSVATVNSNGVVTAVGLGNATITATSGGKYATCEITVEATPVSGVTLSKSSLTFNTPNATQTLTATVNPSTATDKTVTWSSSNTSVVTVNSSGKVTVVGVGTATITANASGKTANCSVTVSAIVPTRKTSPSASISYLGDTLIGVGDILPTKSDIRSTISDGTWSNNTQYAGGHNPIVLTMNPNQWGQTAMEGTYTISGSVTFLESVVPVDNFGASHPENKYSGGTVNTNTIYIYVINPIFINGYLTNNGDDNRDITYMRRYVLDYRTEKELYVTVPEEVENPTPTKFKIGVASQLSSLSVLQFNPLTQTYDTNIPMKYVTDHYERVNDYTNTRPTKYKITFTK